MTVPSLRDRMADLGRTVRPTRTLHLPDPAIRLFAKLESDNPSGSAKDRAAYWIMAEAVRRGEVTERTTVVESSSGNFALALAQMCRELGLEFVPVLDPNVNADTLRSLRRTCRRVEIVTDRDDTGGYLLTRLARVAELLAEEGDTYWPNQYANPDGARGHYELTGGELVEAVPTIDYLFVGVGTGATIAGLSQRVRESSPGVHVIAVDVEGSVIFGGRPGRRLIPGIGSSIRPPLLDGAVIDEVVVVSEWAEAEGCRQLQRDHGIHAGGSTGCVYAAIGRYFDGFQGPAPSVAFVCADRGEPYGSTVYDPGWVSAHLASPAAELSAGLKG